MDGGREKNENATSLSRLSLCLLFSSLSHLSCGASSAASNRYVDFGRCGPDQRRDGTKI